MCLERHVAKPCSAYGHLGLKDRRTEWRLVPTCWNDSYGEPCYERRTKTLDSVGVRDGMAVAKTSDSSVCQRR
jgi:hypothetical protein